MITARELAKQKRQARRERELDARKADRARLRQLRTNIRRARVLARDRRREVVQLCREGRVRAREQIKAIRARMRLERLEAITAARTQSRSQCEARKARARSQGADSLQRAAAVLEAEQAHQRGMKVWTDPARPIGDTRKRKRSAAAIVESDSEVEHNIPHELVPVWRAVRGRIKASPRRSRTEAFLEWSQEHAGDVLTIVDAQIERDVAKLVADERRLRREVSTRSTYARASDRELEQRGEVPF